MLKYKKKLIFGVLVFFIVNLCLFGLGGIGIENNVYAADNSTTQTQRQTFDNEINKDTQLLNVILKFSYVLLYPILFLAAKLVDNSLVYGEIFGFDAVLWQLWNIVKNFSNIALGFIFVFYIFKYLISRDKKRDPKWIITRSLIAGIGIQASWFLMAVLIDISTILIYGVGGLPISILGKTINSGEKTEIQENLGYNSEDYDPYVLKTIITVDANNLDDINTYLTNIGSDSGKFYISECETFSINHVENSKKQELILGPKMLYYQDGKGVFHDTDKFRCSYLGMVYYFNTGGSDILTGRTSCAHLGTGCINKQIEYNGSKSIALQNLGSMSLSGIRALVEDAKILEIGNAHVTGGIIGNLNVGAKIYEGTNESYGIDIGNKLIGSGTSKMSELLEEQERANSYVGVFTSLYSSLSYQGKFITQSNPSTYVRFLNTILLVAYNLAIIIPLIVMAIVFAIRIGIIWLAIVLSPAIVLLTAFELFKEINKKGNGILSYFEIKNLIPIIFSPAIICFAISMSLVLVSVITKINTKDIETNEDWILGGLVKMDISGFAIGVGELIISIVGVAITWFLVWTAIQSSKIGEMDFVKNLKDLTESWLGSVGVIPIPTKEGMKTIGVNKAFGLNGNTSILEDTKRTVLTKFENKDVEMVNQLLGKGGESSEKNGDKTDEEGKKLYETYSTKLFGERNGQGNWTDFDVGGKKFENLSTTYQEQIIEYINTKITDVTKLKKFGAVKEVTIGSGSDAKKYQFNENENKYVKVGSTTS